MTMLETIKRFFGRSIRFDSLNSFIAFLKCSKCASVTAELLAVDAGANLLRCGICFSAATEKGRRAIFCKEFLWSKTVLVIALDVKNTQTRGILSGRLGPIARTDLARIRREVPGIQVSIVDLDGNSEVVPDTIWSKT